MHDLIHYLPTIEDMAAWMSGEEAGTLPVGPTQELPEPATSYQIEECNRRGIFPVPASRWLAAKAIEEDIRASRAAPLRLVEGRTGPVVQFHRAVCPSLERLQKLDAAGYTESLGQVVSPRLCRMAA